MKKSLSIAVMLLMIALATNAGNSMIVQEGACNCQVTTSPSVYNYSSINAATTSAALAIGDTIYIRNRAGNLPWTESVSITKGVTIVPYNNDDVFYCQGTWSIAGTASQTINIVGMYNYTGSITATAAAVGGTVNSRCTVRILGGQIGTSTSGPNTSGYINFNPSTTANGNYYDVWVHGMKIFTSTANYSVAIQHGSIIGDSIVNSNTGPILVANDAASNGDTVFIIGNILASLSTSSTVGGINWTNSQVSFDIRNNLIYQADAYGIYVSTTRPVVSPINKIYNNTIIFTGLANGGCPCAYYGMYLNPATTPATIEVQNNLLARTQSTSTYQTWGIYSTTTTGIVNCYYNFIDNKFNLASGGYVYQIAASVGNNTNLSQIGNNLGTGGVTNTYPPTSAATAAGTALGYYITSAGYYTTGNNPVNAGNPGLAYANLGSSYSATGTFNGYTQNTIGCYGGPYNLQNYFSASAAYPYMTGAPTRTYITPSMMPSLMTTGTSITTGMFKSAHYDK